MKVFDTLERQRNWAEEERLVLDQVRRFADDGIAARAAEIDRTGEFPWDNVRALTAIGANAIFVPAAYGGLGMSYRLYLAAVKIIAEACASTGIIYSTTFNGLKSLIDIGTPEQKQRLLPRIAAGGLGALAITEPTAGSDATGMKTRFTPHGDSIVVEGGKIFITNGDVAELMLLFGKWSELGDEKGAITALLFETKTPGFEVIRKEDKMGHRGSSTAAIAFNRCRVPRANLLGEPGEGLALLL